MSSSETWAVVMAGGTGTRFWPLSRRARPKQLLPLVGNRSLLSATVERLAPLVTPERILVVTGAEVAAAVQEELPSLPASNLLVEPVGRDTAACVGLASWWLQRSHPDAVTVVVPADHVIPDGVALRAALAAAAATAWARGGLVTLGVRPTRAETGFGYVEIGEKVGEAGGIAVHRAARFIEKPDRQGAEAMLAAGTFRWNSGMFAWRVDAITAAIRRHLPGLAEGLDGLFAAAAHRPLEGVLGAGYAALPRTSVDFGVLEKATNVWLLPVDFAWSDVGSWPALREVLGDSVGCVTLGEALTLDTEGSVIVSEGPLVVAVGVRDLVIVATGDAVLVIPARDAQRVKEVVARLEAAGREDLL